MKEKNIAFILISSAIMILAWIIFNLYHTAVTSNLDPQLTEQTRSIAPNFNQSALDRIVSRKQVPPTYDVPGTRNQTQESSASADQNLLETVTPTSEEALPQEGEQSP